MAKKSKSKVKPMSEFNKEELSIQAALSAWNMNAFSGAVKCIIHTGPELYAMVVDRKTETGLHWLKFADVLAHISKNAMMLTGFEPWKFPTLEMILCSKSNLDQAVAETQCPIAAMLDESNAILAMTSDQCIDYIKKTIALSGIKKTTGRFVSAGKALTEEKPEWWLK